MPLGWRLSGQLICLLNGSLNKDERENEDLDLVEKSIRVYAFTQFALRVSRESLNVQANDEDRSNRLST